MFAYFFALMERVRADCKGVTALEYGLIAAAMAAVLGTIFTGLTGDLSTLFAKIGTQLTK